MGRIERADNFGPVGTLGYICIVPIGKDFLAKIEKKKKEPKNVVFITGVKVRVRFRCWHGVN